MAELSKTEANEALKRTRARARELAKRSARLGTTAIITIAGGVGAGFLDTRFPYIPGTRVPTSFAAGMALIFAAAGDMFDQDANDRMAALGSGMIAALAARHTAAFVIERSRQQAGGAVPAGV